MTITAKFSSTCPTCHHPIAIGDRVNWERGRKAVHVACPAGIALPVERPTVDLSGLVTFLRGARDRGLKFPKVRFAAPGNGELQLSLAGDDSKNPGAVYVKLNGAYTGKVTASGAAYGLDALVSTLQAITADPAAAGASYGALTGRCSFCDKPLTDDGSLEVGYGPICARRYGLPHTAKGSAATVPTLYADVEQNDGEDVSDDIDTEPTWLRTRSRYDSRYTRLASGAEVFTNARGRCEDAPCCGCCS